MSQLKNIITTSTPGACVKQRYGLFSKILRPDLFLFPNCLCPRLLWHSVEGYGKINHASCVCNRSYTCEISGFCSSVVEDFNLLGCYARRRFGSWLPTFRDSLSVLSSWNKWHQYTFTVITEIQPLNTGDKSLHFVKKYQQRENITYQAQHYYIYLNVLCSLMFLAF